MVSFCDNKRQIRLVEIETESGGWTELKTSELSGQKYTHTHTHTTIYKKQRDGDTSALRSKTIHGCLYHLLPLTVTNIRGYLDVLLDGE